MTDSEARIRSARASLAQTRAQLALLFKPPRGRASHRSDAAGGQGDFPRSATLRLILNTPVKTAALALGAGFALAQPTAVLQILRWLPIGAISSHLLARLGSRDRPTRR